MAMELGLFDLAVEDLRAIGSPADVVSISRGKAGRGYALLDASYEVTRGFAGQKARPDLEAAVSSGLFDLCVEVVVAVASAGVEGFPDTNHTVLYYALNVLSVCSSSAGCEATIRSAATELAFCLENSLEMAEDIGASTAQMAAQVKETGAVWRPHTKAIRSPALARMLVDGGAVGVTCAKVSQAAVLVRGGVKDVLLANEIVGPQKVAAMVALSKLLRLYMTVPFGRRKTWTSGVQARYFY